MICETSKVRLSVNHSVTRLDHSEGVVLDLESKYFRGLNETAVYILEKLEETKGHFITVNEIFDSVYETFSVAREVLEQDLIDFLTECADRGIIEIEKNEEISAKERK